MLINQPLLKSIDESFNVDISDIYTKKEKFFKPISFQDTFRHDEKGFIGTALTIMEVSLFILTAGGCMFWAVAKMNQVNYQNQLRDAFCHPINFIHELKTHYHHSGTTSQTSIEKLITKDVSWLIDEMIEATSSKKNQINKLKQVFEALFVIETIKTSNDCHNRVNYKQSFSPEWNCQKWKTHAIETALQCDLRNMHPSKWQLVY